MPTLFGGGVYGLGVFGGTPAPDDSFGPPPLAGRNAWEAAALQGGAKPIARLTVEAGGSAPVELSFVSEGDQLPDVTVSRSLATGVHWTATLTVGREPGQDTEALVTRPGAMFRLWHGWDFGGGYREMRPYGVYQLAKMPELDRAEPLRLSLNDRWSQIDACQSLEESFVDADTDPATAIRDLVQAVDPTIDVRVYETGAPLLEPVSGVNRAEMIAQIAQASRLFPHFDAEGRFEIEAAPVERTPVASLSDGENATLTQVTTEAVFATPYNCVVIEDGDVPLLILHVGDPQHPSHRDQPGMGVRPYRTKLPVGMDDPGARAFAEALLAQLVGGVQRRTFSTWGRGDLNPGDWLSVIEAGTYLIPQRASVSMVEEIRHNPLTVATEIITRSVPRVLTEEG